MRDDGSGRRQVVDEIVAGSSKIDVVDEMRDSVASRDSTQRLRNRKYAMSDASRDAY